MELIIKRLDLELYNHIEKEGADMVLTIKLLFCMILKGEGGLPAISIRNELDKLLINKRIFA